MEMKAKSRRKAVGVFMGDLPLKEKNRRSWWTVTDRVQFLPWWLSRGI